MQVAQEGEHRAKVDFAPRIVADGYLNSFQQFSPEAHANLGVGFIKLEWGLYEGGKRVAELDLNNSKIREARAQADSIAQNIAFQVSQAYYRVSAVQGDRYLSAGSGPEPRGLSTRRSSQREVTPLPPNLPMRKLL